MDNQQATYSVAKETSNHANKRAKDSGFYPRHAATVLLRPRQIFALALAAIAAFAVFAVAMTTLNGSNAQASFIQNDGVQVQSFEDDKAEDGSITTDEESAGPGAAIDDAATIEVQVTDELNAGLIPQAAGGAGIGGGGGITTSGAIGDITISGGTVKATGKLSAQDIGKGGDSSGAAITTISGGSVHPGSGNPSKVDDPKGFGGASAVYMTDWTLTYGDESELGIGVTITGCTAGDLTCIDGAPTAATEYGIKDVKTTNNDGGTIGHTYFWVPENLYTSSNTTASITSPYIAYSLSGDIEIDASSAGSTTAFTLDENLYDITYANGTGGTISDCNPETYYGSEDTNPECATISPNEGYTFAGFSIASIPLSSSGLSLESLPIGLTALSLDSLPVGSYGDKIITAQWTAPPTPPPTPDPDNSGGNDMLGSTGINIANWMLLLVLLTICGISGRLRWQKVAPPSS
jgi:hypothetical protein